MKKKRRRRSALSEKKTIYLRKGIHLFIFTAAFHQRTQVTTKTVKNHPQEEFPAGIRGLPYLNHLRPPLNGNARGPFSRPCLYPNGTPTVLTDQFRVIDTWQKVLLHPFSSRGAKSNPLRSKKCENYERGTTSLNWRRHQQRPASLTPHRDARTLHPRREVGCH